MLFSIQLKALLWKNFKLRFRKPFQVFAELIWPLILFAVLIIIKAVLGPSMKIRMEDCYFEGRSMPSAGIYSFFRSYFCTLSSPCYDNVENGLRMTHQNDSNNYASEMDLRSIFVTETHKKLIDEFEEFLNTVNKLEITETLHILERAINTNKDLFLNMSNVYKEPSTENLTSILKNANVENVSEVESKLKLIQINLKELYNVLLSFNKSNKSFSIYFKDVVCNQSLVFNIEIEVADQYLCKEDVIFWSYFSSINWIQTFAAIVVQNIKSFTYTELNEYGKAAKTFIELKTAMNNLHSVEEAIKSVFEKMKTNESFSWETALCGPKFSLNENSFFKVLTGKYISKLDEYQKEFFSKNSSLDYCDELFKTYTILKPLFIGKILYTPESEDVNNIINEAKKYYKVFLEIIPFLDNLDKIISSLYQTLSNSNSSLLREFTIIAPFFKTFKSSKVFTYLSIELKFYFTFKYRIKEAFKLMNCLSNERFLAVKNEMALNKEAIPFIENKTFLAGLVFNIKKTVKTSNISIPFLNYKIRVDHNFVKLLKKFDIRDNTEFFQFQFSSRVTPAFIQSSFVYMQDIIDHAFIKWYTGEDDVGTALQQFPSPCYVEDLFLLVLIRLFPLFMVLSWLILVPIIVKDIVKEKELKLNEFMKVMRLSSSVQWLAWFIYFFSLVILPVLLLTILVKIGNLISYTNTFIFLVFLLIYMVALITQCFMYSVCFRKSNTAAAFSVIFYFILFLPYKSCVNNQSTMKTRYKLLASLSFTSAFGFGSSYIARYEALGEGIQWNNILKSTNEEDEFNFGCCVLMIIFDSFLHVLLTLYIEAVFPGRYGIARPWYYPIKWNHSLNEDSLSSGSRRSFLQSGDILNEPQSSFMEIGISIVDLVKNFKKLIAVNNLNVDFYKNQITGFLGHNGAGKTTTMSIITGLYSPTSGTVYVNDMDVRTQIKEIRKSISLCPQHNILYDDLTVMEHLLFYSMLKGLSKDKLNDECNRLLNDLDLNKKMNVKSAFLSGGMKRKLSIGIAYIGSPDVVVLDEPTAGVDAYARRSIWDLIQKYKKNRTTILSTHLMDEADILSDRLVIINRGQICCSGSIMFLKKQFGKGYRLNISFEKLLENDFEREKQIDALNDVIKKHVNNAELEIVFHDSRGLSYNLPYDEQDNDNFSNLFSELNLRKTELGFSNYGLSNTTLESVFIEANKVIDKKKHLKDMQPVRQHSSFEFSMCPSFYPPKKLKFRSFQMFALWTKRFYFFIRSFKTIFCQFILPPIFLSLLLIIINFGFKLSSDTINIELHPWLSKHKNLNLILFLSRGKDLNWDVQPLEDTFLNIPGMGNKCMDPAVHYIAGHECKVMNPNIDLVSFRSLDNPNFNALCNCLKDNKHCMDNYTGAPPPELKLNGDDILQNLTNYNIQKYLIVTQHNFSRTRFAGIEFKTRDSLSFSFSKKILIVSKGLVLLIDQFQNGFNYSVSNISKALTNNLEMICPNLFKSDVATVWFNHQSQISIPAYINVLHNALIRSKLNGTDATKLGLAVYLQSINMTTKKLSLNEALEIFTPMVVLFVLTIIPSSFLFFILEEKNSGVMHLQFISGINSTFYWITNFIWDSYIYFLTCLIFFIIFIAFDTKEYISKENAPTFILLLLSYGWAVIPLTYFFVWIFDDPNTGYVFLSSFYFLIGLIPLLITFVLDFIPSEKDWNDFYQMLFSCIPQFSLARGLNELNNNQMYFDTQVSELGEHNSEFIHPLTFLGKYILALFIFGLIALVIFLLVEFISHKNQHFGRFNVHIAQEKLINTVKDEDVLNEEKRILNNHKENNILALTNLMKYYKHGSCSWKKNADTLLAVNDVTFGVLNKECFGLLGVNGAGKTTLFKILTGDIQPTSGNIYLKGSNITQNIQRAQNLFGYCPQFDALCNLMTVEEHLILFSKLRGASSNFAKHICQWGYSNLDLLSSKDTLAMYLSGGNKRKLSIALALIGSPEIVYLDEPTAGIDPRARKHVWECIIGTVKAGQSVVLSSHSLEECEFLCNRITIMVAGQFKCLGTIQHLKNKFNEGYTIDAKLKEANAETLFEENYQRFLSYMNEHFPEAKLLEHHISFVKFQLPPSIDDLSLIFKTLTMAKTSLLIDDYSINQTTLEQIFLSFAKQAEASL